MIDPQNMNKPAVEDRHREAIKEIDDALYGEQGLDPETMQQWGAEILAKHEAKEIRELRERVKNQVEDYVELDEKVRSLALNLNLDVVGDSYFRPSGEDLIDKITDQIRLLTAERDRLKAGFLFCLGECDGKYWKENSDEVKAAWEVSQALSAKHDGGGA